jgi:hypothetical protein
MSHGAPALEVRADNLVNATVGEAAAAAAACVYRKQPIHQHTWTWASFGLKKNKHGE